MSKRSSDAALGGQACRRRSRGASGVSSTAPPLERHRRRRGQGRGHALLAQAERRRAWRRSRRRAGASSPERSASVPIASRASAVKRMRSGSGCCAVALQRGDLDAAERQVAGRRACRRPAATPSASVDLRVERRACRSRLAPTARSRAGVEARRPGRPRPASRRDVGVERAGRLDQRERGERRDVGGASARAGRSTGAVPLLRQRRRSAGSGRRRARGRRPSGRRRRRRCRRRARWTSSSSSPPPLRLPVTSAPSTWPSKPMRALGQAAAHQPALGDRRGER